MFTPPKEEQLASWLGNNGVSSERMQLLLDVAYHNPLLALSLNDDTQWDAYQDKLKQFKALLSGQSDVFTMTQIWMKLPLKPTLDMLFLWLLTISHFVVTRQEQHLHLFQDLKPAVSHINLNKLNELMSQLANISPSMNLNAQLLWEDIFFKLTELTPSSKR